MAGNSSWFYESFRRENFMSVNQYVEFNKFKVFSKDEKNSFLHVDLSDDVSFYRGFVKYFLDETRLLRYAENKANLEFSPDRRNYVTLFKHLSHYLDDYNQETLPREIEEDVFRILTDEYHLNDPGDGNLHVRLDKIGKLGEYIFCNLLSEYFGFDCIIPKVHLTTDFNMSVFGIDTLFYSSKNIRHLDSSDNPTQTARELAEDLFSLDLTVYSSDFSFDSLLYSAMAKSILDESLSLHPEQIQIINEIAFNDAVIVSAPTSFGKTFCIFEYIARVTPQNIVLIVPTLALVDEYVKRVTNGLFNKLLCTSTLLEGVNTTAKNIIITKPSRMSDQNNSAVFSAFDFYNLVGRTGRLNQHFVGNAYYIKAPGDPEYRKIDAIKSIKFEITDNSKDIDIQKGDIARYPDVIAFLDELGISIEDYHAHIGSQLRFDSIKTIYTRYKLNHQKLVTELNTFIFDPHHGRLNLVKVLFEISKR